MDFARTIICKFWTIPCFGLGARIFPPPLFMKIRGGVVFVFFLILAPAGDSNQTSFLALQGILHGSLTLRAPFLAQRGKKLYQLEISTYHYKKTS